MEEDCESMMFEHPHDDLPAYALGCLTEPEMQAVEQHLAVCSECRAEVASLRTAADMIALSAPQVQPPARVKQAILAQVQPEKRTMRRTGLTDWLRNPGPALGAAALAVLILLLVGNLLLWNQVRSLSRETNAGSFQVVSLQAEGTAKSASGVMIVTADGRYGTLVVDGLPVLGAEQQYQLWLIVDGERTSGGLLTVDRWGYGAVVIKSPLPLTAYTDFGVTIEPSGGSPQPTGEKVLGGSF